MENIHENSWEGGRKLPNHGKGHRLPFTWSCSRPAFHLQPLIQNILPLCQSFPMDHYYNVYKLFMLRLCVVSCFLMFSIFPVAAFQPCLLVGKGGHIFPIERLWVCTFCGILYNCLMKGGFWSVLICCCIALVGLVPQ